jgi:hypothetical protein
LGEGKDLAAGAKVFKRVEVFIFLFILVGTMFLMVLPEEVSFWSLLDRTGERCVEQKCSVSNSVLYIQDLRYLGLGIKRWIISRM